MNYHELEQISEQLKAISHRIDEIIKSRKTNPSEVYPIMGTWRDKIFYVLKYVRQSATAREIAEMILRMDDIYPNPQAHNSIVQTCSNLANEYPPQLIAEGNYNKKYSLPKKEANG